MANACAENTWASTPAASPGAGRVTSGRPSGLSWRPMRLRDFISDDAVRLDLAGTSKDDVLQEMAQLLHADDRATATLLRILRRREHLGSTGVGRGIAIPHCRTLVSHRLRGAFGRHPA